MITTEVETEITKNDRRYDKMKVSVVKKAVKLLEDDLFEHVTDPYTQAYFNERITYLYLIASAGDSDLLDTKFLRSLHSTFNNYYQSYQSPLPGKDVSDADRERHFLYREVNDQIEDFLCNY